MIGVSTNLIQNPCKSTTLNGGRGQWIATTNICMIQDAWKMMGCVKGALGRVPIDALDLKYARGAEKEDGLNSPHRSRRYFSSNPRV